MRYYSYGSGKYYTLWPGSLIEWGPWKEKYAWLPRKWEDERIWLRSYYVRKGVENASLGWFDPTIQITTSIFDVLNTQ